MKKYQVMLAALAAAVLAACGGQSPTAEPIAAGTQVQVRIMETTDLHAYMVGYDYFRQQPTASYGLAHTAALIHAARAEQPNNFLVDNGDLIQGSALGDWVAAQGSAYVDQYRHPIMRAFNYLQYDVGNLGNHEFNFGLEFLESTIAGADFPYVSANVFWADSAENAGKQSQGWDNPLVEPYVIVRKELVADDGTLVPVHVGFIGFLPPQIMRWDQQHLEGQVRVRDMVAAAEYYVPKMRAQGADLVVAIPHSGLRLYDTYPEFAEQATYQLAGVSGLDALMFGHQHQLFPGSAAYDDLPEVDNERGFVRGVPAVSPGYWGDYLGIIDFHLEYDGTAWSVINSQVEVRPISEAKDTRLEAMMAAEHEATVAMLNEPLGELETAVTSLFGRIRPGSAVQMINDAQRWFAEGLQATGELPSDLPLLSAAAPFRNGFQSADDYTMIAAGEFTLGSLVDLYVYPNTLQVVELTGAQLIEWLEMSALAYRTIRANEAEAQELFSRYPSFNFDVIDGLSYRFDLSQPPRYSNQGKLINTQSRRVHDVRYQGEPIDLERKFLVAVNNYRAGGGGNFPGLDGRSIVYSTGEEVRQVIAAYARAKTLENNGNLAVAVADNWSLKLPEGATVRFRGNGSELAAEEAQKIPGLREVRRGDDGFVWYELNVQP
ncbi:bifunctional 2',3'-cyclic-nucleotide 2'-phosphodiesterase/3'-nucleotidase [Aliidiomarina haloalkalitolerans]|uniref:Bifunctional 2',3'-cyclic-nucleotide 2'-phosphodiesterase/3'-nucleotidase n=1 Tax=Aliidiomarina haloalkalitolerans TaxID=859059 RepID=A0A432VWC7_9GAMM|nr:bifunctional 2',3'-cyclic-nucleotide 2'-phosphodiesterase/3'-nucleotidase [Aliidiomarina haloalkalitolerans]RUO20761.1 bifunctional 2',3'-cyclic-nucleotide 2'-phosphodiesterase/3'-nucleotidase [Aliidiomarina haloalkalitolerans]